MKKAFTLAELMIVIMIIGLVFLMLGYISWSYIYKLNLQNDKESFEQTYNYVMSQSLSQASYKNTYLTYIGLNLEDGKQYFTKIASTGNLLNNFVIGIKKFSYLSFSGLKLLSGNTKIDLTGAKLLFKSYNLGVFVLSNGLVYSGNKVLFLKLTDKKVNNYCYKINLELGKLEATKCN